MNKKKLWIKSMSYSALLLSAMPYLNTVNSIVHAESKANEEAITKTGTTEGVGDKLNIDSSVLDNAVKSNEADVNLVQGQIVDYGTLKNSDKDTINSKISEIQKSYEKQAKEISEKAEAYKAAYKYWSDNKSKTEDLVKKLNSAVKSASDLGAKISEGETISGKSFEDIQSSLQKQIDSLSEIANKQKEYNDKFTSEITNYETNKSEIEALETQLKSLVEQGTSLGATITNNGEIKDAGTINQIKDLLQNQVNVVNELVKKQQENVNNYKAALTTYNDKISKINEAKTAMQKAIETAQSNGATVNIAESTESKSLDEIIESYTNQATNISSKSDEAKSNNDKATKAKEDANTENAAIDARNKAKTEAYNTEKAEYDKKLAEYNKAKIEYEKALEAAKAKTTEAGHLSKAVGQTLVFLNEPNASLSVSGADATTTDAIKAFASSAGAKSELLGQYNALSAGAGTPSESVPYLLTKSQPITATYTNLQNTTLNGKKISKVVYTYTLKNNAIKKENNSKVNVDWMGIGIFKDPTLTLRYVSEDADIGFDAKFYDESGNLVKTDGAISSFASLNTSTYGSDYEGVTNFNGEFITINDSSINVVDGIAKATNSNASKEMGSKYDSSVWDVDGSPTEYYGAIAGQTPSGRDSISFDIVSKNRGYVWFEYNSNVKSTDLPLAPTEPVAPTPPTLEPHVPVPDDNTGSVTIDVTYYKTPDAPVQSNLTGTYSSYTLPAKPEKTIVDGSYNKFVIPSEPVKDTYTYSYATLSTLSTGTKSVVNSDKIDINGKTVILNSDIEWKLSIDSLPKTRSERESLEIEDALPIGFTLDEDTTKSLSTEYWTYSYDKENHTVKYMATEKLIKEINADTSKEYIFDESKLPSIKGKTGAAESTLSNVYKVTDTIKSSSTDKNGKKTPPKTTTYTNKVIVNVPKNSTPKKTVTNEQGENIDTNKVTKGSKINYNLSWDLTSIKGLTLTASQLVDGNAYIEDFDEDSVSINAKDVTVVDKDGKAVEGLEITSYDSLNKAPKAVQDIIKKSKQTPKGKFIYIKVKDSKEFIEKYVNTNDTLTIKAEALVTKSNEGQFTNTGTQIDYGNGYSTNTVTNKIVKPNPTKQVTSTSGADINSQNIFSGDTAVYKLGWNLSVYKDIMANKSSIAGGFMYLDDIDETKVDVDVYNAKVVTKDNTTVPGITFTYYDSLDKAPENVQKQFAKTKINGGFVVANVENPQDFYDNYVKTGTDLTIILPVKVKENISGLIENIAYQVDFAGNTDTPKVPTNKVENNMPTQKTTKYFQAKEKADLSNTKELVSKGTLTSKDMKYSWIIEQDLDSYSVKNKLYKGLSIVDGDFADIQTVENATIYDADKKDVSKDFDIEVYVDDKLYSVNGDLAENAKKSKVKIESSDKITKDTISTETYESDASSKSNNVLLPSGLNTDGEKGSVKIIAKAKIPSNIKSTKYYVTLNGVSISKSSDEEYNQYIVSTTGQEQKVQIGNVADSESVFGPDNKVIKTKESKAKLTGKTTTPTTPTNPTNPTTPTNPTNPAKVAETAIKKHPIVFGLITAIAAAGSAVGIRFARKKSKEN